MQLSSLEKRVRAALREDRAGHDATTRLLFPPDRTGSAKLAAREQGVVCGVDVAGICFRLLDRSVEYEPHLQDGANVKAGVRIATVRGPIRSILSSERLSLNLLCRLSGIATLTAGFVARTKPWNVKIYDTRKTTPLWRDLEKYAVRTGGGHNHRFDLSEACFIKDNHVDALGGLEPALERLFQRKNIPRPVIVETRNYREVKIASRFPVDVILLDNMPPSIIKKIITRVKPEAEIEISGGVTLSNVEKYARTGVSRLSIGALTHSVKALDIGLDYEHI